MKAALVLLVLCVVFFSQAYAQISWACTAKCAAYYVCLGRGAWAGDTGNCEQPSGCICDRFAKFDDEEESDAEFFKRVGRFLKKHVNPTNIQKGLDIYRTIKGGDDVEADAEFFKRVGRFLKKHVNPANIQKGLDIYNQFRSDNVEADWFLPAAKLAVKYGPAVYSAVRRRRRDAEESDIWGFAAKFAAKKLGGALIKRIGKRRDEEESDAEFFKRVGRFLKKHVNPANIQKGLDIYNQFRSDNVESDAEFFKRVGRFLKKHVNPTNIQKGLDIYRTIKGGDDVEADAEFFKRVGRFLKKHVNPTNIQKGLDIYRTIKGGDDVEADWFDKVNLGCTAKCAAYYTCHARAAWNDVQGNCAYPSGCECRKFAWQN